MLLPKTIAILALMIAAATSAQGAEYRLEGQLTAGTALFPPALRDPGVSYFGYGAPAAGFPVPFAGRLTLGPANDEWTFDFTAADPERTVSFAVGGPQQVQDHREQMFNQVVVSTSHAAIEFRNSPLPSESFALNVDLAAGSGSWEWKLDCPVCDLQYPRPSATATITGATLVPEPGAIGLVAAAMLAQARRIRTLSAGPRASAAPLYPPNFSRTMPTTATA